MGVARRNSIVAFACVTGPVSGHAAKLLIGRYPGEQVRQHWRIPDAAARKLDGPYLRCFLINSYMSLAPKAVFGSTMLARIPLAFALSIDACAIYQQVQRPG